MPKKREFLIAQKLARLLSLSSLSTLFDVVGSQPFYAVLGVELVFAEKRKGGLRMNYLDGLRDGCRLCLAKVKAAVTRESAVKEIRSLIRLAKKGKIDELKEMLKNG